MSDFPFLDRDVSWIDFNARVLDEALNVSNPLLERLKFLGIVSSNFDEFFMVRVAGLKAAQKKSEVCLAQAVVDNGATAGVPHDAGQGIASAMSPGKMLETISERVHDIVERQYDCLMKDVLPALAKEGLDVVEPSRWTAAEKRFLESYFGERVLPLVTPLRIEEDAFPSSINLRIHCAFGLESKSGESVYAIVQVPLNVARFVTLPEADRQSGRSLRCALVEDVIVANASRLFPGYGVRETVIFKITRDADFGVDESRQEDFLTAMEEVLAGRHNSTPVRLGVSGRSAAILEVLQHGLGLGDADTYRLSGPIDLAGFYELASLFEKNPAENGYRLRDRPWPPISLPSGEGESIWEEIERADRLLSVPYESFDAVTRFVDEAADDPSVLAIKMTLYRTSGDSKIVKALIRAARRRKQVAVVVELKARFDEERNIEWASTLEQAGAIVTFGVARLKVHAKLALVIRRSKDGSIRKYLHLSTGNYNDRTAKLYSDLSIFTANEELCRDASALFNMLTGYSSLQPLTHIVASPHHLKDRLIALIEREVQRTTPESPGLIEIKVNALADTRVIEALYRASQAGVKVKLNVRGACTLLPGLPDISPTVEVRSVLGRYLEHSRIFHFRNGGKDEVYLASADCLPRNLERRVEILFPVLDEKLAHACRMILGFYFKATEHAYRMKSDGSWEKVLTLRGEKPVNAQEMMYRRAKRLAQIAEAPPEQFQVRRRYKAR
jgi:polyphosphate kinase